MLTLERYVGELTETIREKRGWFIFFGISLMIIGLIAIISPHVTTLATEFFIGWVLIFSGVAQIIHSVMTKNWKGFFWELLIGILQSLAGVSLLYSPILGVLSLTIILGILFIVEGGVWAFMSFQARPEQGWGWILANGIVTSIAGVMILAGLPASSIWAIGLLVGISIFMSGVSLLMLVYRVSD